MITENIKSLIIPIINKKSGGGGGCGGKKINDITLQNNIFNLDSNATKVEIKKEPKKRQITETTKWKQLNKCVTGIELLNNCNNCNTNSAEILSQQIKHKITSYKYQDIIKQKYNSAEFINYESVIELLKECNLMCFYCGFGVELLYENVREPRQWTLERIDNTKGHNRDNVKIACLSCNLKRRTMYHERYVFTKKCIKIEKIT